MQSEQSASGKDYREWDTIEVSSWLTNQVKLPQYGVMFGK